MITPHPTGLYLTRPDKQTSAVGPWLRTSECDLASQRWQLVILFASGVGGLGGLGGSSITPSLISQRRCFVFPLPSLTHRSPFSIDVVLTTTILAQKTYCNPASVGRGRLQAADAHFSCCLPCRACASVVVMEREEGKPSRLQVSRSRGPRRTLVHVT
ncbi:hypothetical protein LY76DRAFT_123044 [Colletotrichum caudatum]|nr:hypothetical protein LY76DRAFT_123044 [Colletotrichum caudatum]